MSTERQDSLTERALVHPDRVALIEDLPESEERVGSETKLTYGQLNSRANRLAHAIRSSGLRPGSRILWCGMNSVGVVTMMHAARKAWMTPVPLNYRLSAEEAEYIVNDSDSELIWVDADCAELIAGIRARTPRVREVVVYGGEPLPGQRSAEEWIDDAEDTDIPPPETPPKTMIYTSGTTGRPKGAVRTTLGDPEQLARLVGYLGYQEDDVYLTTGPLYHSGPGGFMSIAFRLGNTVVLQRRFQAEDWLRLLQKHRATSTFSAPTPIRLICNLPAEIKARYDRSSLRIMVANAAPWSFALKKAYLEDFPKESLFEVYGSTELGVNMVLRPEDQLRKPGSCGKPAPGVSVILVDEDGHEIAEPNRPGEVFVSSPSVYDTYHKAAEKYEADRRGEFHTVGDIAYRDEEGFYFICDRKKDMIISGGMNIYPAEVEAALEEHPDVLEAAVFGVPSEEWGESTHAVVVLQPGAQRTPEEVRTFLREHLAHYKVPRSVTFAESLPKTGSGKILKRELRAPFWAGRERSV